MPQFDILTLSSQVLNLLISLYLFYYFNITSTILGYTEIKKYRAKKLVKNQIIIENTETSLNNNFWLLKNSYRTFL